MLVGKSVREKTVREKTVPVTRHILEDSHKIQIFGTYFSTLIVLFEIFFCAENLKFTTHLGSLQSRKIQRLSNWMLYDTAAIMIIEPDHETVKDSLGLIKRLKEKTDKALQELQNAREDGMYLRLEIEMKKTYQIDKKEIYYILRVLCRDRFRRNTKIKNSRKLHQYTYGDILDDRKIDELCMVVHETECYVTSWYYQDDDDENRLRKRLKKDSQLVLYKLMPSEFIG